MKDESPEHTLATPLTRTTQPGGRASQKKLPRPSESPGSRLHAEVVVAAQQTLGRKAVVGSNDPAARHVHDLALPSWSVVRGMVPDEDAPAGGPLAGVGPGVGRRG